MTEVERPNPDRLLAAIQKEDARTKRGKLKVFFGMAPGVGKTSPWKDIHAVRVEGDATLLRKPSAPRWDAATARDYGLVLGVVAAVTGLNALLKYWLGYQSLALIYLLTVVILAMVVGRGPTLAAATFTALSWNFFFAEPRFSLRLSNPPPCTC